MKKLFRTFITTLLGNKEQIDSERYFMIMVCLTASIFLFILSIFHLIGSLHPAPVYLASGSSIVTLLLYFLVRFTKCLYYPKLILTVLGLFLLDLTWYAKFLSLGPVLYFIFAFGALVIWVWEGRSLVIMISLYFLNILTLFLIEYFSTDFEFSYASLNQRSIDIYLSFFLYSVLLIFILVRVKADFQKQRIRAIRSDDLKTAFLANMSHEFRTPMNSISGFSELLENENDPEKRKQFTKVIKRSADNLMKLIDELVDLSKIEAGDVQMTYSEFSIREIFIELHDFYSMKQLKNDKSRININYHFPDGDLSVYSDEIRLKQILSNLLSNSLKFTTNGSIDFSCSKVDNQLVFSVTDTGTGIPESDQSKIFERFTKFDYHGLNTDGSGIGLSIVEKMVELLDGRIWFNSVVGVGTSFFFSIPHNKSGSFTESRLSNKQKKNKEMLKMKSTKSILVVEDDISSFQLIREILRSLDIEIHHVVDGQDAIDFIKQNPGISLILMDIKLPHLNGYKASTSIKESNPDIIIIAQTAFAMVGDREKSIAAGCSEYLSKPLDPKMLTEMVMAYLSNIPDKN